MTDATTSPLTLNFTVKVEITDLYAIKSEQVRQQRPRTNSETGEETLTTEPWEDFVTRAVTDRIFGRVPMSEVESLAYQAQMAAQLSPDPAAQIPGFGPPPWAELKMPGCHVSSVSSVRTHERGPGVA